MRLQPAIACALIAVMTPALCVAAPDKAPGAKSVDQNGGVTASSIGTVTQNYYLPIVQSPFTPKMKEMFTAGAQVYGKLKMGQNLSDGEVVQLVVAADAWSNSTFKWLRENLGQYQAERFRFTNPLPQSWWLPGEHDAKVVRLRSNVLEAMPAELSNLDMLMRDGSTYADRHPVSPTP